MPKAIQTLMLPLILALYACATPSEHLSLIPTPVVFQNGKIDPFALTPAELKKTPASIYYVTDRLPVVERQMTRGYAEKAGEVARLGVATVSFQETFDWDELKVLSLLAERTANPVLKVTGLTEFGVLSAARQPASGQLSGPAAILSNMRFLTAVDYQLERSAGKDIVVFVDDPQIRFQHTLTRSAQLWHYLGYEGAMVVYAWSDSSPGAAFAVRLRAFLLGSRHLRTLLQLLVASSEARTVHIIACNSGSLVVYEALKELHLIFARAAQSGPLNRVKLGQVIFTGRRVDRSLFDAVNRDDMVASAERVSFYLPLDQKPVAGGTAMGSAPDDRMKDKGILAEVETGRISLITAPPAEWTGVTRTDGFFGRNPWLSSDVLVSLKLGLGPGQRGLVRDSFSAAWSFPVDYIDRVQRAAAGYERPRTDAPLNDLPDID